MIYGIVAYLAYPYYSQFVSGKIDLETYFELVRPFMFMFVVALIVIYGIKELVSIITGTKLILLKKYLLYFLISGILLIVTSVISLSSVVLMTLGVLIYHLKALALLIVSGEFLPSSIITFALDYSFALYGFF